MPQAMKVKVREPGIDEGILDFVGNGIGAAPPRENSAIQPLHGIKDSLEQGVDLVAAFQVAFGMSDGIASSPVVDV